MYRKPSTMKSATGLSYMTSTLNEGRLIQIVDVMQGGRPFMLKFSSEFTVNMDHWATFMDSHLHRG